MGWSVDGNEVKCRDLLNVTIYADIGNHEPTPIPQGCF